MEDMALGNPRKELHDQQRALYSSATPREAGHLTEKSPSTRPNHTPPRQRQPPCCTSKPHTKISNGKFFHIRRIIRFLQLRIKIFTPPVEPYEEGFLP
ncbi:hypothetical protein TNCT_656591 [Trichonephila clavata]|uniref:Uncharacterized protein n=1 Tax=Trichonephila clavata TaxID=2740835 RepID=A0A8X6GVJ7_TRICU|nr:hypothetical protein TNCT_656591 [Trichonephila clavata]